MTGQVGFEGVPFFITEGSLPMQIDPILVTTFFHDDIYMNPLSVKSCTLPDLFTLPHTSLTLMVTPIDRSPGSASCVS